MRLRTLGGLTLEGSSFRRTKPLLFLCYLALEGPRPRRELAELFWPRAKDPRDSLSVAISQLRKRFPTIVETDRERVWTELGCDAHELLELVHAQRLEEAVAAYRGPFLEGLDLPLGVELEEWVFVTREFIAGQLRETLLLLGEREAAAGRSAAAASRAEEAYLLRGATEPGPEDLQRLYRLLRSGGSRYAASVRASVTSYGIAIADGPAAAQGGRRAVRHNLPRRATSFVGRDPERLEIETVLGQPDCRLLTLHGPGGIGKSRLALEAAHDLARDGETASGYEGGVFLVPLDALSDPELVPVSVAKALALQTTGRDDPFELVVRTIGNAPTLLLLDNFEHLTAGAPLLTRLLEACSGLKLLVTSRERLNLEEEWLLTLEGLSLPPVGTSRLEDARHYGAVQLFLDRAQRARLDVSLSDEDLPPLLEICRLVGGAPLGIELAAVWVRALPVAEVAAEVASSLGFLETPTRNVPERQRSIQAAFEHSWRLLPARQQMVLRRLSVFVGGFSRGDAAQVTGATLPLLVALTDRSLLAVSTQGRYRLHPLIDRFARDKLAAHPEERREVRERHAHHYLDLVRSWHGRLGSTGHKEAWTVFEAERDNVRSAWQWAIDAGDLESLRRYAAPLSELVQRHPLEGAEAFAGASASLDAGNPDQRAALGHVLVSQADQLYGLGDDERASVVVGRALALLLPLNDPEGIVRCLQRRGELARRGGDLAGAEADFREGLERADKLELARASAWFSAQLARVEIERGYTPATERHGRQVLDRLRDLGQLDILALHLGNLGWLYLFYGLDWRLAKPLFEEGLQLAQAFGMHLHLAPLLDGLARIAQQEGDLDGARAHLLAGLEGSRNSNNSYAETFLSLTLAAVEMAEGRYQRAQRQLLACLRTAQQLHHHKLLFRNLTLLADLAVRRNDPATAVTWLSLVRHHIDAPERDRAAAQQQMEELQGHVTGEVYRHAVEQGRRSTLTATVAGILDRAPTADGGQG